MEKRVLQTAVLLMVLIFSSEAASANTYYVRADGNNGNDGLANTTERAWRTIDFAGDRVSPGDVVRVLAGNYAERVSPSKNGSSSGTLTFVADGAVQICGFDFLNSSYIRVIGFIIDTDTLCAENDGAVLLSGTNSYLELWNNTIRDAHYGGVRIGLTDRIHNSVILGNYLENFGIGVGNGSGTAVAIRGNNNLVAYNEVKNSHPDAFFMDGTYNRWINNYTHGLSEASGGHSDVFQAGSSTLGLSYNLIEATFQVASGNTGDEHTAQISHGQAQYCSGACGAMTENIFRRNVWHNVSAGTIGINQSFDGPITNTRAYNNSTVQALRNYPSTRYSLAWYGTQTSNSYVHNELFYEGWGTASATNLEVFYIEGGVTANYNLAYDPDGVVTFGSNWTTQPNALSNADPRLSNIAADDFTLGASSGAIGVAGPLTRTSGSGTGRTFNVSKGGGGFFRGDNTNLSQYAGNLVVGDTITVGTDVVTIQSISNDAITVESQFTWVDGEPVYLGGDTTPDIGAYPYNAGGYTLSATYAISGATATVTPNDASLVRFVVCYSDGVPYAIDNSGPYTCAAPAGTFSARVYPRYASKTLWVTVQGGQQVVPPPAPPSAPKNLKVTGH